MSDVPENAPNSVPEVAVPDAAVPEVAVPAAAVPEAPSAETLKAALKAFKKRIKVTQLDQDSRVGRSPLSSNRTQILSISPPNQYPTSVWQALVAQGKLKYAGQGMYELVGN